MAEQAAAAVRAEFPDPSVYDQISDDGLSDIPRFKQLLAQGNDYLDRRFAAGEPVRELLQQRARFIDRLLCRAWDKHIDQPNTALVAVGGYGRSELHPGSDIDLMILIKSRRTKKIKLQLETFLTFLWDVGLEVQHSVRTVKECVREARTDITIATNIMEARLLQGDSELYTSMLRLTGPDKLWPSRKFFAAKWNEQIERHKKYANSENNLEPNIKEGPGGLRDIQVIAWVAKRHFDASSLQELVKHKFLLPREYELLDQGMQFLWRIRYALHTITGRREDRLLFEHQKAVAKIFAYESGDNLAVEQFMKKFYRTVKDLKLLNDLLLQHFQEQIIYAKRREKIRPINKRFQIRNGFIEVCNNQVFKRYPPALLEIFLQIQLNANIQGIRAGTVRLIRNSLDLIDDAYRADIRNRSLFMEIIRQPHRVGHELRRMHKYGVLGAYLPEFKRIEGLMQFDLFHVYTVDEHILSVVQYMRWFGLEQYRQQFPVCQILLETVPKQELLYLAGIFHDVAKGRGGNHSTLGAEDALEFCRAHGLSEFDSKLVAWLVEKHLLMSMTAQREDLNNPEVINTFARKTGDVMHLNYLYMLTVADINGTNPQLWNNWKDSLLLNLYNKTLQALRRGLENPIDKTQRINEVKENSLALIKDKLKQTAAVEPVWANLSDDYFIRYSADEISWHTCAIIKHDPARLPLILMRAKPGTGTSEIFVYMLNKDNIFSRITQTLDNLQLNILDARIISSAHGYTLDTFIVLENDGSQIKGRERKRQIMADIRHSLLHLDQPPKQTDRVKSRRLKHFKHPVQVSFSIDESNRRNIMEVSAADRPGFLSAIGTALEHCGARLQAAKIATYGERVEDIFFITDRENALIKDEQKLAYLDDNIRQALEPEQEQEQTA
ncbi:MAG: [protein-PII] uridylyltransferase [Gammaproteobacteria bacterium]